MDFLSYHGHQFGRTATTLIVESLPALLVALSCTICPLTFLLRVRGVFVGRCASITEVPEI